MDEKVDQKPPKTTLKQLNTCQINISDLDLDEIRKQSLLSPVSHAAAKRFSNGRSNCLCSPTTHAGSFRCRLHRNPKLPRGGSVGSNLSALAKTGGISD